MVRKLCLSAAAATLLAVVLPASTRAATPQIFNEPASIGWVDAFSYQDGHIDQVDMETQDATVVYPPTDTSGTWVEFDASYSTEASVSAGCQFGAPVCDTVASAWLTEGSGTADGQTATCTTGGVGCTDFGTYYEMDNAGTLTLDEFIPHGVLQTVNVSVALCGYAAWYEDANGDSNPYGSEDYRGVTGSVCQTRTVTVTPIP